MYTYGKQLLYVESSNTHPWHIVVRVFTLLETYNVPLITNTERAWAGKWEKVRLNVDITEFGYCSRGANHNRVHKSLRLGSILSQIRPVYILYPTSSRWSLKLSHLRLGHPTGSFCPGFLVKHCVLLFLNIFFYNVHSENLSTAVLIVLRQKMSSAVNWCIGS
jgi:hypothetical protein